MNESIKILEELHDEFKAMRQDELAERVWQIILKLRSIEEKRQ